METDRQVVIEKWIKPPNLVEYTNSRLVYFEENTLLCDFFFPTKYQENSYILNDQKVLAPQQMYSGKRYFYKDRFYSLLEYFDKEGNLSAYYLDLTLPARVTPNEVLIADLKIDFFVFPDKKTYLLLDEDEWEEAVEAGYFSDREIKACEETKNFIIKRIHEGRFDAIFTEYAVSEYSLWPVYGALDKLKIVKK